MKCQALALVFELLLMLVLGWLFELPLVLVLGMLLEYVGVPDWIVAVVYPVNQYTRNSARLPGEL